MEWQQYFEGFWFSFPVVIKLEQGLVTKGVLLIIQKRDYYQERMNTRQKRSSCSRKKTKKSREDRPQKD